MDARHQPAPREHCFVLRRPVGRIRPDVARRVCPVQNVFEPRPAPVRCGVRRRPVADQAEAPIDRDVVLVAERRDREVDRRHYPILARLRLGVFDRPARIPVFLRELRRLVLPVGGNVAFLDRLLLFDRVALGLGVATIVASTIWPLIARKPSDRSASSKRRNRPSIASAFFSAPRGTSRSCWRLWNPIGQSQPEEAHKGQPVFDQKLRALVRQRVHRLKDQSLEHQHMIEGRPAALRSIGARNCGFERRAEHLEINQRLRALQTVALGRQFRQPIVKIGRNPATDRPCRALPLRHDRLRSIQRRFAQRFLEASSFGNRRSRVLPPRRAVGVQKDEDRRPERRALFGASLHDDDRVGKGSARMSVNLPALLELLPEKPDASTRTVETGASTIRGRCPYDAMKATGGLTRELVEAVDAVRVDARWGPVYRRDLSAYDGDHSRADLALCGEFARLGLKAGGIDTAFRTSGLYRDKWERDDYRDSTIAKALTNAEPKADDRDDRKTNLLDPQNGRITISTADPAPRDYLLEGLLVPAKSAVLAGFGGVSKTQLALQLAIAVALGNPFMGKAAKRGNVIVMLGEEDRAEIDRRLSAVARYEKLDGAQIQALQANILAYPLVGCDARLTAKGKMGLTETAFATEIIERATAVGNVRLIVLDHMGLIHGGDFNAREDAALTMRVVNHVAQETGASVMVLAHTPKSANLLEPSDASMVAGSTAFVDQARGAWVMATMCETERARPSTDQPKSERTTCRSRSRKTTMGRPATCTGSGACHSTALDFSSL